MFYLKSVVILYLFYNFVAIPNHIYSFIVKFYYTILPEKGEVIEGNLKLVIIFCLQVCLVAVAEE